MKNRILQRIAAEAEGPSDAYKNTINSFKEPLINAAHKVTLAFSDLFAYYTDEQSGENGFEQLIDKLSNIDMSSLIDEDLLNDDDYNGSNIADAYKEAAKAAHSLSNELNKFVALWENQTKELLDSPYGDLIENE